MKITKSQLRHKIRKVILEMNTRPTGLKPPSHMAPHDRRKGPPKGSEQDMDDAVKMIVQLLERLDDPKSEWPSIEMEARQICKQKGVHFGPVIYEALEFFDVYY